MNRSSTVLGFLIVQLIACSESGDQAPTFAVRDTVGVKIVENFAPAWPENHAWRLEVEPLLDLSGADDDELFRTWNARLLPDGRVALFNGGNCEVRFYDQAGGLLAKMGRCGEGPGEFGQFAGIWPWRGDSVLVVEQGRRLTFLGSDGSLGRTVRFPTSSDIPLGSVRGVLADGTLVLAGLRDPIGRDTPGMEVAQFSLGLLRDPRASPISVGLYPGPVYEYAEFAGNLTRGPLAFSGSTEFAAGNSRFFVGLPDRFEIRVHTPDGGLERIIRRVFEPVAVTRRDIDWLMDRRLGQVEGQENQAAVRQAFRNLRHAEVMPAFGRPVWPGGAEGGPTMLADDTGNLWIFVHYRPGEYRNDWSVFSPDGVWLGTVNLPERLTPSQIGADFLLGRSTDETGFTHIQLYRLLKHDASPAAP